MVNEGMGAALVVAELHCSNNRTHIYPSPSHWRWQRITAEWGGALEGSQQQPLNLQSGLAPGAQPKLSVQAPSPPLHLPGSSPGSRYRETRLAPFSLISTSIYDIDVSSYRLFHLAKSFSSTTLTPLKTIYCCSSFLSLCLTLSPSLSHSCTSQKPLLQIWHS